jgi:hypothetical protein
MPRGSVFFSSVSISASAWPDEKPGFGAPLRSAEG